MPSYNPYNIYTKKEEPIYKVRILIHGIMFYYCSRLGLTKNINEADVITNSKALDLLSHYSKMGYSALQLEKKIEWVAR